MALWAIALTLVFKKLCNLGITNTNSCPYLPKSIICDRIYKAKYKSYLLKLIYFKVKKIIKKQEWSKIAYI